MVSTHISDGFGQYERTLTYSRRLPLKRKSLFNSWNEGFVKKHVSTIRKKSLWFVLARNSVSNTRNEAFVEKYFSSIRKNCFLLQKIENGFHQQENIFLLKLIPPYFHHGFQKQKKGSEQNFAEKCVTCSHVLWRNQFFLPGMHRQLKETYFY